MANGGPTLVAKGPRQTCHTPRPQTPSTLDVWPQPHGLNQTKLHGLADYLVLHDDTLQPKHLEALRSSGTTPIMVPLPDSPVQYTLTDRVALMKIWLLNLNYDTVVFLDGDAFAEGPLHHLFLNPPEHELSGVTGGCEPMNAGQFVLRPRTQTFQQLYWTFQGGDFNVTSGWNNTGRIKRHIIPRCHSRRETHELYDWRFAGAHIEQGLFFYIFHYVRRSMHLVGSMRSQLSLRFLPVIHYAGFKPWSNETSLFSDSAVKICVKLLIQWTPM
eukprot:EG_transcript_18267